MQIPYRLTSLSIDRRLVIGVSTKLTLSSKPVNSESFTIKSHDCSTLQFKSPMSYTSAFREKELMLFSKTWISLRYRNCAMESSLGEYTQLQYSDLILSEKKSFSNLIHTIESISFFNNFIPFRRLSLIYRGVKAKTNYRHFIKFWEN